MPMPKSQMMLDPVASRSLVRMARHLRRLDVPGGAYDPLFQDIARLLELLADPDMPITPAEVSLDFPEPEVADNLSAVA